MIEHYVFLVLGWAGVLAGVFRGGQHLASIYRRGSEHPLHSCRMGLLALGIIGGGALLSAVLLFSAWLLPVRYRETGIGGWLVFLAFAFALGAPCFNVPLAFVSLLRGEHPRWPALVGLILSFWPVALIVWGYATR